MSANNAQSHILIVDAAHKTQTKTSEWLDAAGFLVTIVKTCQDALKYLRHEKSLINLVILEGKLSDDKDLDIFCQLKKSSHTKSLLILRVFTAEGAGVEEHINGAFFDATDSLTGVDSCLTLPIAPSAFITHINILLRLEAAERNRIKANQETIDLLAVYAHELRNPLAPILNSIEIMQKLEPITSVPQEKARMVIKRQAQYLVELVDEFVDSSLIAQGAITLDSEVVAVDSIIHSAIEANSDLMNEKRHLLVRDNVPPAITIKGDKSRLIQIMTNVFMTAAKLLQPASKIHLSVANLNGYVQIIVAYNKALIEHINVSLMHSEQKKSTITASLITHLIAMHDGAYNESDNERYHQIELLFPVYEDNNIRAHEDNEVIEIVELDARKLKNILVVDDRVDVANTLAQWIGFAGHSVQTAYTGAQAIESTLKYQPEIVLLDIGLPDASGFDIAKKLCELKDQRDFLLVAVTGFGDESSRQLYLDEGFDEYFVKPMDFKKLKAIGVDI